MSDESARLAALRAYRILDTRPEQAFDDLALLASHVCDAPIAFISMVDEHRQWFKARVGLSQTETARSAAFCAHTIQQRGLLLVPDALEDERFRDNPMVQREPHIRFYAGTPLVSTDGHAIGTLCVVDCVPRQLTADQRTALEALGRQAQAQLELRRNLVELEAALAERDRADANQAALVDELRVRADDVRKLSALIPLASTCELNLVIPATPVGIQTVSEGVTELLRRKSWPEDEIIKVDLALQEALANGIRHGCQGDPTQNVQCVVSCDADGEVTIVVRDPGPGFDAASVPNPLDSANMMKPTGRGVFLINQLMDEVAFADQGREVQMRKRLETPKPELEPEAPRG